MVHCSKGDKQVMGYRTGKFRIEPKGFGIVLYPKKQQVAIETLKYNFTFLLIESECN